MEKINLERIIERISNGLGIDKTILNPILLPYTDNHDNITISLEITTLIETLIDNNEKINKFGNSEILNNSQSIYSDFKNKLGILQLLVIINKIKESHKCNEKILNFISILNKKLSALNSIERLKYQTGGGNEYNKQTRTIKYIICLLYLINIYSKRLTKCSHT